MDKFSLKLLFVGIMVMGVTFMGCGDDDENPMPNDEPTAGFTFAANELEVTFTNSSTNATTYTWDFGDGNTSTEESPTHTYAEDGTYDVTLTAKNGDNSDEDTQSITVMKDPENVRLTTGFIVTAQTEEGSWFAQYFEELPTGVVDITQGTAFQTFFPLSVLDGAIYMARPDGSAGFAKLGVNGNGEIVEDGIISTISDESFVIAVRDKDFGLFHDRNDPNVINTFNPTSMQVTGTIDMTVANAAHPDPVRYQDFIFRGSNEVFAPMRLEAGGNVDNVALPRIDISAGAAVDVAEFEDAGNLVVLNSSRRFFDESGNFYYWHAGDIGFPTISGAILKINAGQNDYDPTYNFKVPEVYSPQVTGAGSFLSAFNYYKDGRGFALVNTALDPQIFALIQERGGVQNLTDEDFQMIQFWLFNSPTGEIVEVDLDTQSASAISGLPAISVFDNSSIIFLGEDEPYFSISNPSVNALFRYDEGGTATKVFDLTGAQITTVVDLSQDVQ
ncbi:MAG: PKD domain-containing protein [Bacteroidota bacterium]